MTTVALRRLAVSMALLGHAALVNAQGSKKHVTDDGVRIGAGTVHMAQRDESASPLRYTGAGQSLLIDLGQTYDHYVLRAELNGSSVSMESRTASVARSTLLNGDFALLRMVPVASSFTVEGGLEVGANIALSRHTFGEHDIAPSRYRFATVLIGPAAGVSHWSRFGVTRISLALPVAGVVDRPFSAVKTAYAGFVPRLATVHDLRTLSAGISFTTGNSSRLGASARFAAETQSYLRGQPLHAFSTTLSAGMIIRGRAKRT